MDTVPATTPIITGVRRLLTAKTVCQRDGPPSPRGSTLRKTKEEPRRTIPRSISVTGMCRAVMMTANAGGKAVNRTTTTTINQTWFASQIGPMACAMVSR